MGASRQARPASPATLAIIRLGILGGVLAFGGVVWYLQRQPGWSPASVDRDAFFYAGLGILAVSTAGLLLLRSRWQRETDPARRTPLMIVGWALGEVPAIFGGVQYLLTGDPQRYFTGLMFLVMAFLLLPVRARPAPGG
jgi:hypothetical protein